MSFKKPMAAIITFALSSFIAFQSASTSDVSSSGLPLTTDKIEGVWQVVDISKATRAFQSVSGNITIEPTDSSNCNITTFVKWGKGRFNNFNAELFAEIISEDEMIVNKYSSIDGSKRSVTAQAVYFSPDKKLIFLRSCMTTEVCTDLRVILSRDNLSSTNIDSMRDNFDKIIKSNASRANQ